MMLRVSETAHENDGVVPDIGRGIVQSSTTRKCRRNSSQWVRNTNYFKRASSEKYVNKHQEIVSAKKLVIHASVKGRALKRLKTKSKLPLKDSCSSVTKISKMPTSFHLPLAMPLSEDDHELRTVQCNGHHPIITV